MLVRLYNEIFFEVDEIDLHVFSKWSPYLHSKGYIGLYDPVTGRHSKLHRVVLSVTDSNISVDHADGNPLNNTRKNLRVATATQNNMNRGRTKLNKTGKKGVSWNKKDKKYRAQISIHGIKFYLGNFDTVEEACAVYERAAKDLFGPFYRPQ
jgi:hypothetical protein